MVIKTKKGMYQVQRNYREAFNEEAFTEKYIEECMDKYLYVVGDISSGILRLKGFDNNPKSKNYYGFIDDYLETSCAFGCPYYILKRIRNEQEFEKLLNDNTEYPYNEVVITPIKKENFDKESLMLKSTPKEKANILLDMNKINSIPKGKLSKDLEEFVQQERASQNSNNRSSKVEPKLEDTATYVSASPDFDPSKSNSAKFNRNNNQNHNKNKNNNNNFNRNKNHNKNNNNNGNKK